MKQAFLSIGLVVVLAAVGCGSPKTTTPVTPVVPPPPTAPVVDLSKGTFQLWEYSGGQPVANMTMQLKYQGAGCPLPIADPTFQETACYLAQVGDNDFSGVAPCFAPLSIFVIQGSDQLQFDITENDADQIPSKYVHNTGSGSITSNSQSSGAFSAPCNGTTVTGTWEGYLN